ncbi:MAG TPA: amidotransferase [Cellvibrio sp.]|nr:amidotransferase [Cellvibrio sp.]
MRIHSLQHVAFEDIGSLQSDLRQQGHSLTTTHWYQGDRAPSLDSFELLIVMGGPMGVYDEDQYPWLTEEKAFLLASIRAGKKVMGICLGAQLISCVLGAQVTRNAHREIGWFPLSVAPAAAHHPIAKILADCEEVFHWHGDTFALPPAATLLASSAACAHQAYAIDEQILAFQFHLETTPTSAQALIEHCGGDLDDSTYVQRADAMLGAGQKFAAINRAMSRVWKHFIQG